MGFLKRIAEKSYLQGHKSSEFAVAAQGHADAFWWPLIAAGAVWWFAGWKWALLPLAVAVWWAFKSMSATIIKQHMERLEREMGENQ
jgi:hypothetical protein